MAAKASLVRLSAPFFWGAGCSTSAAAHEMGDCMLPRYLKYSRVPVEWQAIRVRFQGGVNNTIVGYFIKR
ncbi:hypothetical protein SNOG_02399 [Parastagonospora nodorum SN15]|uniref:Uncharacterized protein n=1 Tax=Phaeosphaeria nodorum (strain SN15 / ATCC MYA-4574 / FGSC 10173) TaxID=321614 RepID=Q0V0R5_PHANO|nr:hypothetical protein SNOG_02399 [Parastagonospora nodorum SN15]EAT90611.1 hypothetical protein SNOG_02399 [Parastagonospora nodorum SN15]